MENVLVGRRAMGRPRKATPTSSVRIAEDALQLANMAVGFTGESLVDYLSRVVRDQAEKDARAGAEAFLKGATAKPAKR